MKVPRHHWLRHWRPQHHLCSESDCVWSKTWASGSYWVCRGWSPESQVGDIYQEGVFQTNDSVHNLLLSCHHSQHSQTSGSWRRMWRTRWHLTRIDWKWNVLDLRPGDDFQEYIAAHCTDADDQCHQCHVSTCLTDRVFKLLPTFNGDHRGIHKIGLWGFHHFSWSSLHLESH